MNEQPVTPPELPEEVWEKTVRETAREFPYPPTPDVASAVRRRLSRSRSPRPILRAVAALVLIALVITLTVPEVRATLLEFIRIGAVQIFLSEPTATPTRQATQTPFGPVRYASVLELPGETTLADAQANVPYPILLPDYPSDLGAPDRIFVQPATTTPLLTLVWLVPGQPDQVRMSIEVLTKDMAATKYDTMGTGQSVQVNGDVGYWMTDAHRVVYYYDRNEWERDVQANVLIWEADGFTYRLETIEPLNEALVIANSLK